MSKKRDVYFITGGSGFIGSNFIHYLLEQYDDNVFIINYDKLTYAGNPKNLASVEKRSNYRFYQGDICDGEFVERIFNQYRPDYVINFAAESHVDRSIGKPEDFIKTDTLGVFSLLEASRKFEVQRFIQISTDEVYGSIEDGKFTEASPLFPSSPYSASKAGGDRLAYSYFVTYDMPVIITRASNNYGPMQYPEKLIPLFITNAMDDKKLPIYGDGKNVRDWVYVKDHCSAVEFILRNGKDGEIYNVGGNCEKENMEITQEILKATGKDESLIKYVKDRAGHDRRYALDDTKLEKLGWKRKYDFATGMKLTADWYKNNRDWWEPLKSGEYLEFYKKHYGEDL